MPRRAIEKKAVELDRRRAPFMLIGVIFVGSALTVGAVMWGRSDTGEINVSATIANSQYVTDNNANENAPLIGTAAQEYVDQPNGGLVPTTNTDAPAPPPAVGEASTTATTTELVSDTEGSVPEVTETPTFPEDGAE